MITSKACIQKFKEDNSFRLTEGTIKSYQKSVEQLVEYCRKAHHDITTSDIRRWMIYLEENGYKSITVKMKLAGLKLFYRYCMEEELIKKDPAALIPFPSIEEKLPRYLELTQLNELRKFVKGNVQRRAVIEVLYATGVRISELAAMKKEDINWSERTIHIPNGKRKKARIVLFTRTCVEHLKVYLEKRKDDLPYVFVNPSETGPVCIRTIGQNFEFYTRKLGIHISPHTLRHTFAAHLAIKGMALDCIQMLLGHNGPHQTQLYARIYSHARKEKYDDLM